MPGRWDAASPLRSLKIRPEVTNDRFGDLRRGEAAGTEGLQRGETRQGWRRAGGLGTGGRAVGAPSRGGLPVPEPSRSLALPTQQTSSGHGQRHVRHGELTGGRERARLPPRRSHAGCGGHVLSPVPGSRIAGPTTQ